MVTINTSTSPSAYVVGTPASRGFNAECSEFARVTHVTHVTHAYRVPEILRSGAVGGRLVYDASTLNNSRIHVVWVSPNHWTYGFRYGTVGFAFDWARLIAGRNAYWIEVAEYGVHACRILLAHQPHPGLTPYDPTLRSGPWWHDTQTGKHYYNSTYCLEVMVEGDLPLSLVAETMFVSHHKSWCSEHPTNPKTCPELGTTDWEGGARFLARITGSNQSGAALTLHSTHLTGAWGWLKMSLRGLRSGAVLSSHPTAAALARSALWHFGTQHDADANALLDMFASDKDADDAIKSAIELAFGLPAGTLT